MESKPRAVPVSGLEVRVLVGELSKLKGWYVSSVHSLGENQVLRMKSPEGDSDLVVSPAYGAWLTASPAHGATAEFTTGLRQRLERLKLEGVRQEGLDRVVTFSLSDGEKVTELTLELIPPGNVVVTDGDGGRILLCLREYKGLRRTIAAGKKYLPPPGPRVSLEELDEASLRLVLASEKTVGRALGRGLSLPRRYVDEVLSRSSMDQEQTADLPDEKVLDILGVLRGLVAALANPSPCLVEKEGRLELMSVKPTDPSAVIVESAQSMSPLMDRVFVPMMVQDEDGRSMGGGDQKAKEIEVTMGRLEVQASQLRDRAVGLRELATKVRDSSTAAEAEAAVAGSPLGPSVKEELEGRGSVAAMASLLYDEAKSAESEAGRIDEISAGLAGRLKRAQKAAPKSTVKNVKREKKEWYEKFRWFFTSKGKLAVGGRDAQSNTILIKKHVDKGDVVYHADLFGSPFFVLKGGEGQTPDEEREAGQATAAFSSAWKTGLSAADAYWVMPDQVSSTAPSGEYLAKGSFVIRGKKNFVLRNPVEVAVGLDSAGRVASGPEHAVMESCRAYVVLTPSREKSSDTAKKVLFELKKLYAEGSSFELDDVMRALPTGGGKIVRRKEKKPSPEDGVAAAAPTATGQDY